MRAVKTMLLRLISLCWCLHTAGQFPFLSTITKISKSWWFPNPHLRLPQRLIDEASVNTSLYRICENAASDDCSHIGKGSSKDDTIQSVILQYCILTCQPKYPIFFRKLSIQSRKWIPTLILRHDTFLFFPVFWKGLLQSVLQSPQIPYHNWLYH